MMATVCKEVSRCFHTLKKYFPVEGQPDNSIGTWRALYTDVTKDKKFRSTNWHHVIISVRNYIEDGGFFFYKKKKKKSLDALNTLTILPHIGRFYYDTTATQLSKACVTDRSGICLWTCCLSTKDGSSNIYDARRR